MPEIVVPGGSSSPSTLTSPVTTDPLTFNGAVTFAKTGKTAIEISDSGAQNSGLTIGGDTNLFRSAANELRTEDRLVTTIGLRFGTDSTGVRRTGAGIVSIDDSTGGPGLLLSAQANSVAFSADTVIARSAANELSLAAGDSFRLGDGSFFHWGNANNVQTTVGAAGAAAAVPATPTRYLKVKDSDGTTLVVPAFAAS